MSFAGFLVNVRASQHPAGLLFYANHHGQLTNISYTKSPLTLLRHPGYVPLNSFIGQQQLFGIKVFRQLLFVRNDPMNALVAFTADTNPSVCHFLFRESLQEILLPVHGTGNQVMLRKRLSPLTELAVTYGSPIVMV